MGIRSSSASGPSAIREIGEAQKQPRTLCNTPARVARATPEITTLPAATLVLLCLRLRATPACEHDPRSADRHACPFLLVPATAARALDWLYSRRRQTRLQWGAPATIKVDHALSIAFARLKTGAAIEDNRLHRLSGIRAARC